MELFSLLLKNNVVKLKKDKKSSYRMGIIFLITERYSSNMKNIMAELKKGEISGCVK